MRYRYFLLGLLLLLMNGAIRAQVLGFDWVGNNRSSSVSQARHVAVDQEGNVIVAGEMMDMMDVDPGPGSQILTHYTNNSGTAPFVEKLDSNGALLWGLLLGGDSTHAWVEDVVVDDSGNVYLTGWYPIFIDIDPGPNVVQLTSSFFQSGFLLKLDPNGAFVWAVNLDSDAMLVGTSVALDGAGGVYAVGKYQGNADVDPGPGTGGLTAGDAMYVAKYTTAGAYLWGMSIDCPVDGSFRDEGVAVDAQGNVLVTGSYKNGADFDPGPGVVPMPNGGAEGNFVLKLTGAGNLVWVNGTATLTGAFGNVSKYVCTDPMGNVYTSGVFVDSLDFDTGPGVAMLYSEGSSDLFVMKQDANGNFLWARSVGSAGIEWDSEISTDDAGNVYFAGILEDTADLDPGPGVHLSHGPLFPTGKGSFVEKLDPNGNLVDLYEFGDTAAGYHLTYDVATDPLGAVLIVGAFNKPSDFDPRAGVVMLVPQSFDAYILRLHHCTVDTGMTMSSTTLTSNASGASYQWLDCDNGMAAIVFATGQNYTPPISGNYAVAVAQNGCIDTSGCHTVTVVGVDPENEGYSFKVRPNPSDGRFWVEFGRMQSHVEYSLRNMMGQEVEKKTMRDVEGFEVLVTGAAGVYFLDLKDERGRVSRHKLVKL